MKTIEDAYAYMIDMVQCGMMVDEAESRTADHFCLDEQQSDILHGWYEQDAIQGLPDFAEWMMQHIS